MALLEQVDAQPQREVVLLQLVDLLLVLPQVQEAPAAAAAGQAGGRAALRHGVARCWNRGQWLYRVTEVVSDLSSVDTFLGSCETIRGRDHHAYHK